MDVRQRAPNPEHEIDLVALWWIVWDRRRLVGIITAVCTVTAVVLALTATPIYRGTVVVTEVRDTGLAGGGLLNEVGGLASIAGLNLGQNAETAERQAILNSHHLIEEFVQTDGVMAALNANSKAPHNVWFAAEVFRRGVLDIEQNKLKGTTTVTIDWTDPVVAARWANEFVALANKLMRDRAVEDSSRNIAYLADQVPRASSVDVQRAMYNVMEMETKRLMLAKGRVEYGFSVADPASVPQVRVSPKRTLMVLSGIVIGLFLGTLIAWARIRFARPQPHV